MTDNNQNDSETPAPAKGYLPAALYDKLKAIALVVLPALSTFYVTFGTLWEFPNVTKVVGTIAALDTLLGVLLGISSVKYKASDAKYYGDLIVNQDPETGVRNVAFAFNNDPTEDLQLTGPTKEVTFKVIPPQ